MCMSPQDSVNPRKGIPRSNADSRPHNAHGNHFHRRIASNFAVLGLAEIICRTISFLVTLWLRAKTEPSGLGRIEFSFNVVFWLILIVRDCFLETIITREIVRHPRLTRSLVNHVLAVELVIAVGIFLALSVIGYLGFGNNVDRWVLMLYGLLLISTALGLDFVFRGMEQIGLVAFSLLLRTSIYCTRVWIWVNGPDRILQVPIWLAVGEFTGIALIWIAYARRFGLPKPVLGFRFLGVFLKRGRSIGLIHLCQAVIVSSDIIVVGLMSRWADVGRYNAPHRIISSVMAFGLILLQQVVFPSLSRSWRSSSDSGRDLLDYAVRNPGHGFHSRRLWNLGLLAEPIVRFLFPPEYHHTGLLLGLGVWRAPLLGAWRFFQAAP